MTSLKNVITEKRLKWYVQVKRGEELDGIVLRTMLDAPVAEQRS